MNRKGYIWTLVLALYVSLMHGQQALDTVCINAGPTHLAVNSQPGASYQWSVNGGQIIGRSDTNVVLVQWGNTPGLYKNQVVAKDALGCYGDTTSAWIYLMGPARASAKGPMVVCKGEMVTLESNLSSNFQWSGGSRQPTISFVVNSDTTVALIALNGSCGNDTLYHQITTIDPAIASMSSIEDTLQINEVRKLLYTGVITGSIDWYVNGQPASSTNIVVIHFDQPGEYVIVQIVQNGGNCADSLSKTIWVEEDFVVHVPNAFTPNGDQLNEYFEFDGVGIEKFTAVIYNRWGEKVYIWNENSPHGWDGTNNGVPASVDVYTYDIAVENYRGKVAYKRGSFTLMR